MNIIFLGTRGGFPVGGQTSCARVESNCGSFVIDMGSTLLFENRTWLAEADHVLMTHLHPDHTAHLAALIIARINLPAMQPPVTFVAPEPILTYLDASGLGHLPGWTQTDGIPAHWCGFALQAIQTRHPRKNHAYRITDGLVTVVWTGDCSYSEELAAFCSGADAVVCEASMKEENRKNAEDWGHMTPGMFARLMNEAKPSTAVMTHYTELEPGPFSAAVRPQLDPDIELVSAYDGFELEII